MNKFLRRLKKGIFSTALALTLLATSVSPAFGVINEDLNNQDTGVSVSTVPVVTSGEYGSATYVSGAFTIWQNDVYDSFAIYKLADITWDSKNATYKDAAWNTTIKHWYTKNYYGTGLNGPGYASYRSYSTPAKLAAASSDKQTAFFKALLDTGTAGNVINGEKGTTYASYGTLETLSPVASFTYSADGSTKTDNVTYYAPADVYVNSSTYTGLGLTAVTQYTVMTADSAADEYVGEQLGIYESESALTAAGYSLSGGTTTVGGSSRTYYVSQTTIYRKTVTTTDDTGATVTNTYDYNDGDVYSSQQGSFYISNLSYGIYAVVATNSSGIIYSPVTVSIAPEQLPPSGDWYFTNNVSVSIKAGDVNIEKKINGKDSDIISIGETVNFSVVTSFPTYKDRVTLSSLSSSTSTTAATKGYTLTFDDELSTAYAIDQSTFKLYYRESEDGEWKEFEDYKDIDYYAICDSTYTSSEKFPITSSNIKDVTYDATVVVDESTNVATYTQNPNYKFASDSSSSDGKTYYYTGLTADAYTYLISSKSIAPDTNASNTVGDNRGGVGLSVFACGTNSHKSYFQLYLFRYIDRPNLYYWYYMRDGAYYFLCVDDIVNNTRSMTIDDGADGSISLQESCYYYYASAKNSSGTTYYYVNTTKAVDGLKRTDADTAALNAAGFRTGYVMQAKINLNNSSSYLKYLLRLYCTITGDTVNHSVNYYADWGDNTFNITFNYNAMRQWMKNKGVAKIAQIKVTYDCVVTSDCEINSDFNSNKAILTYEGNVYGTKMATKDDTVYGYTYGLNLLKVDGDDYDAGTTTPIAGAVFKLYKEIDTFTYSDAVGDYVYTSSVHDSPTTGLTAGTSTLTDYETTHSRADYYYYEYEDEDTGQKITKIFALFTINADKVNADYTFTGEFTSTNKKDGYLVRGLDDGNYILTEITAPDGYSLLSEDILFSINPLSEDVAETVYGGHYYVFADDEDGGSYDYDEATDSFTITGITDDNGVFEVTVENYKGLTLPSTGGMGTLLFTLLGILLMAGVIILLVKNRHKDD